MDYSQFEQFCDKTLKAIMEKLGIVLYQIHWGERLNGEDDTLFECEARYPYQYARLKYSHLAYEKWRKNPDGIVEDLLHEAFHILIAPLSKIAYDRHASADLIGDTEEEVVDRLANAFVNLTK